MFILYNYTNQFSIYIILQVIQDTVYWISNKVGLELLKAALVWSLPVKRVISPVHSIQE